MSWPDPYFSDKRVEDEARNIQAQHDDYVQAQAFWRRIGIGIVVGLLLGLVAAYQIVLFLEHK